MSKFIWLPMLLCVVCSALGCENGFRYGKGIKVGDLTLIQPLPPLQTDRVEITAQREGDELTKLDQKLVVDMHTGRAALTNTDGRVYPQQLDAHTLDVLKDVVESRDWQIGTIKPTKDASSPTLYRMTAFVNDAPIKDGAMWSVPGRKEAPLALQRVMTMFDAAQRIANPLSEQVNLVP